jgi:hypothetical protein
MPRKQLSYSDDGQLIYEPDGRKLVDFLLDRSKVSIIRGPVGSGTSSACCQKIYRLACEQNKQLNGWRQSRWAIVRNTYPELEMGPLATWLFWFPENIYGPLKRSRPMVQVIHVDDVELEIYFFALDNDDDIRKMLSTEFTGFWFNELQFTVKPIFDTAGDRAKRYPPSATGGSAWSGIIADLNAPDEEHWLPRMAGEVPYPDDTPDNSRIIMPTEGPNRWSYIVQPPALIENIGSDGRPDGTFRVNPEAENQDWLEEDYYSSAWQGKARSYIDSKLLNKITFFVEGDPVWPMFREDTHVSSQFLKPIPGRTVAVGIDCTGRQPAAVIGQEIESRLYVQYEFRDYGVGSVTYAPRLKRFLAQKYPGFTDFQFWGDPKGADKGATYEVSQFQVFQSVGIPIVAAPVPNNNIDMRVSAVEHLMNDMYMGRPRLLISPACTTLRAACAGRYQLKRGADGEFKPKKDSYADVADALQYLCIGLGEGRRMIGKATKQRVDSRNARAPRRSLRRVVA